MILESRPDVHNELKAILEDFKIDVAYWSEKGTGWNQNYQNARPDIVFIDYLLSGRSGLECLEKAVEISNSPFFVFMHNFRGLRANELEEQAFTAGADAVIQKPLAKERLRSTLKRFVRQREDHSQRKLKLVIKD